MTTIQNIKNLIRHGRNAKEAPRDQPTTNVSNVHAQPQKYHHGISEPQLGHQKQQHYQAGANDPGQFTVGAGAGDNRNIAAQAGHAAAQAQGKGQKIHHGRDAEIHAIVAEEREKASKMPKYPGLERYLLQEKMGDGAFSNVYRARDTQTGQEVAIKVVRKFEMNNNQVSTGYWDFDFSYLHTPALLSP
jgi:serine/threonine-protein kinase RCK2